MRGCSLGLCFLPHSLSSWSSTGAYLRAYPYLTLIHTHSSSFFSSRCLPLQALARTLSRFQSISSPATNSIFAAEPSKLRHHRNLNHGQYRYSEVTRRSEKMSRVSCAFAVSNQDTSTSSDESTPLTLGIQVVEVNGRPYPPERPLGNGWSSSTSSSSIPPLFDRQGAEASPPIGTPPNNEQQASSKSSGKALLPMRNELLWP